MRKIALTSAGLIAFLMIAKLIHLAVVQYLGQPIGQLYRTFIQLIELAPQDWIWAVIIALAVLTGLRNLSSHRKPSDSDEAHPHDQSESLESWLVLLQERVQGTYFAWRLADRLAALESQIGGRSDPQATRHIREYLDMGHDRRTIGTGRTEAASAADMNEIVTYLEHQIEIHDGDPSCMNAVPANLCAPDPSTPIHRNFRSRHTRYCIGAIRCFLARRSLPSRLLWREVSLPFGSNKTFCNHRNPLGKASRKRSSARFRRGETHLHRHRGCLAQTSPGDSPPCRSTTDHHSDCALRESWS
jgi:hypothetical protein